MNSKHNFLINSLLIPLSLFILISSCVKETELKIPDLTTIAVSDISSTTFTCSGNITSDGGVPVTSRGFCWGSNQNPTLNNGKSESGSGIGGFTSLISGLTSGKTYYLRAYATNSVGTGYGNQLSVTTLAKLPTITTSPLSAITTTSAIGGGNILSDGGSPVIARGVCWSSNQNPTIIDRKSISGSGMGSFSSSITDLISGTTYYVSAYATNGAGTEYGNQVTVKTLIDEIISIKINNEIKELIITHEWIPTIIGTTRSGKQVTLTTDYIIKSISGRVLLNDKTIIGIKSGNETIIFNYKGINISCSFYVNPIEFGDIDPFLSTPAQGSKLIVPIVIINYIPTKNGKSLDQTTFPFAGDNGIIDQNLSIIEYKKWLLSSDIRTKFSIEEGSKFRGYNRNTTPYVGIKVIKNINIYEIDKKVRNMPASTYAVDSTEGYFPDYYITWAKIGMEDFVNNQGVKEIWFNRKSLALPESNMSSSLTGDISNAFYGNEQYGYINGIVQDDLPIYNKTYVVYSHFVHNGYEFNLHVRGHQIEAQMRRINDKIWNIFEGNFVTGVGRPTGCGNTHFTPNSKIEYVYNDAAIINSDIMDWKPDGGTKTPVNNATWTKNYKINYPMPTSTYKSETSRDIVGNDSHGGWLIFWFQSIPSDNNNINYNNTTLSNWWDIFYNWDDAINSQKNLYNI